MVLSSSQIQMHVPGVGSTTLALGSHQTNLLSCAVPLSLVVHLSRLAWPLSRVLICAQLWLWPAAAGLCPSLGQQHSDMLLFCLPPQRYQNGPSFLVDPLKGWCRQRQLESWLGVCSVQLRRAELFRQEPSVCSFCPALSPAAPQGEALCFLVGLAFHLLIEKQNHSLFMPCLWMWNISEPVWK